MSGLDNKTLIEIGILGGKISGIDDRLNDFKTHNFNQHAELFKQIKEIRESQLKNDGMINSLYISVKNTADDIIEIRESLLMHFKSSFMKKFTNLSFTKTGTTIISIVALLGVILLMGLVFGVDKVMMLIGKIRGVV